MAGLISYGAYIPYNRLKREAVNKILEKRGGSGERAVASYDEDTVTMAVEAARNCLAPLAATPHVGSLYFATTEPPYQEKSNASIVHAALALGDNTRSLDIANSVRAGLGSVLLANESAFAGRSSLAAMADIRVGLPEGAAEVEGGDAAAAFLFGDSNPIAEIEATHSVTLEHLSVWRVPGERFPKSWEERFVLNSAYQPLMENAFGALLNLTQTKASDLAAVILDCPNPKAAEAVARKFQIPAERIVPDLSDLTGHCGAAHAGLQLALALDNAKPGDRIAVVSVSDGADAIMLRATEAIAAFPRKVSVKQQLDSKRDDLTYFRFLKWRGIVPTEPPRRPDPERPAGPPSFRSRRWKFAFIGSECEKCGTRHLPPQRVCVKCGAIDAMRDEPFANRRGKVATYTLDRLAYTPQPPMVAAIIDFDGGGRFQSEITDCEPDKVSIGMEVEMTFRRFYTAGDVHNYFWKARPAR